MDNYKTGTLGLPADLPVDVDETLVAGFQLIPIEANPILESLLELQARIGDIGELADLATRIEELETDLINLPLQNIDEADSTFLKLQVLVEAVGRRLKTLPQDIADLDRSNSGSPVTLSPAEQQALRQVVDRVRDDHEKLQQQLEAAGSRLQRLSENLTAETLPQAVAENFENLSETLVLCRGVVQLQRIARDIESEPEHVFERIEQFVQPVRELLAGAAADLQRLNDVAPERERTMRDDDKLQFRRDIERLRERLDDLVHGESGFETTINELRQLRANHSTETRQQTIRGLTAWIQSYLQIVERSSLIPAQARLELITVERVDLDPAAAFEIALANRLDFMNGRAALVDRWRAIQVAADALQSNLTITGSGDVRTARNNPVDFRAGTSRLRLGLEFDAPLARLLERNGYREALIQYQRSRRGLIQSRDSLQKGLRALLRTLEQRRLQLEIQRRAVSIALRRVDQTQLSLLSPPPQGQPGVRPAINPTTAINLLGAQSSLQSSQNSFLAAWLNYYAARIRLYRELGVMQLDADGRWNEDAIDLALAGPNNQLGLEAPGMQRDPGMIESRSVSDDAQPLPPPVPAGVLNSP